VQSKGPRQTILRIDAVFVEDFRHTVHPSNGSVESAEYKDIQDHVDALELQKKQTEESEKHRQEVLAKQTLEHKREQDEASALATAQTSAETLEQHVENLRHQVERVVKAPGAQLKSAPFRSATNLTALDAGAEVVILIVSPYWYGVETEDGQHGWINREQLEPLP
jgi:acyl-CoA reductase-like NAD-dependent aldehyde dehydrogenase